jgi:hypothetical protein
MTGIMTARGHTDTTQRSTSSRYPITLGLSQHTQFFRQTQFHLFGTRSSRSMDSHHQTMVATTSTGHSCSISGIGLCLDVCHRYTHDQMTTIGHLSTECSSAMMVVYTRQNRQMLWLNRCQLALTSSNSSTLSDTLQHQRCL